MAYRVEIGLKPNIRDARGEKTKRRVINDLNISVASIRTIDVYTVDADLSGGEIEKVATGPLLDPIIQEFSIGRPLARDFDWAIEVGYKPGVTDNVGRTARESVEILLDRKLRPEAGVYTSVLYLIEGTLTRDQAERIATGLLANTPIQRFEIKDRQSWKADAGMGITVPRVIGSKKIRVAEVNLGVRDEELLRISSQRVLALSLKEYRFSLTWVSPPQRPAFARRPIRPASGPTNRFSTTFPSPIP